MNKELIRHNVGDVVIALTNPRDERGQKRVKGSEYTVKAIDYCSKCGVQSINIGESISATSIICSCGDIQPCNGLHFTVSFLFAKIEELPALLEEAIKKEEYEEAGFLQDVINKYQKQTI